MKKDILDEDWDWESEDTDFNDYNHDFKEDVVMVKTFNSENQAYIYAATLNNEGIKSKVVGTITGSMTPFDYGTVRLYVAANQSDEAADIINCLDAENALKEKPQISAAAILAIIVIGIFVIGMVIRLFQVLITGQVPIH